FSIGDRGDRDVHPQDITRDGGKIYRLNADGSIPSNNPFVNTEGAKTAIYSYGHRNPQGLVKNPMTGEIWDNEHGPQGGDEINIIEKGKNYGWPVITYGINYSGTPITDKTEMEGMEQPIHYWVPSIAPSGMAFVTSDKYPEWKGNLLIGSLKFQYLERLELKGNKVVYREKLMPEMGRVRDVRQAPDGFIYVAVEGKGIYKLLLLLSYISCISLLTFFLFQDKELEESISRGADIYSDFCINCHMANGEGVEKTFPPLAKSDFLLNKREESIRGVKYGQQGYILVNGVAYNNIMPPMGLEDEEIADVMNYSLNAWGNKSNS
ncbi:unnamed protein product, partial [Scytosiphon promiscuus]